MSEKSHHTPKNEALEPTSLEDLERGRADLERMLRDAGSEDVSADVSPGASYEDTSSREGEDSGEKQLSYQERRKLDPAAPVIDRAKFLRQAYFRQQYEQNWESATGAKDEKNAAARAAADNAIADMTAVDGYPELVGLRDKLRDEKREVTGAERKFLRYIREEEKFYDAASKVRFNGRGGLFDAGRGKDPSIEAAQARIEAIKDKLQKEFEEAGSPEGKREKLEADIAALDFYASRVGQDQMHGNAGWSVSDFLESQEQAKGKGKSSTERKKANAENAQLDTRFDEIGKATRALTLLSKHDDKLSKRENTMKPKSDESLSYVAVLEQPLGTKKDEKEEKPRITQVTAEKTKTDIDEEDEEGDDDEEEEHAQTQTPPAATPAVPVAPATVFPPAQANPNQQPTNPNQQPQQQVPQWIADMLDQMNQTQQALLNNINTQANNQQQFMQAMMTFMANMQQNQQPAQQNQQPAQANPNQQPANANQVHPYHQLYMNAANQVNPPAGAQQAGQGGQQPPAQGGGGAGNPPAGGGANPNQNNDPTPEQLENGELKTVREALAHEKSKTWRNSRLGRLAWRMAGGLMGSNSRVGRSYRNLENLENRYIELNELMFNLKNGVNDNQNLTPEQVEQLAVEQGKYIFDEQEKLREATRELMTEKRRMRKFGNWFLKHKKWVIGGSVVLMPFTGGMSLAAGMGALAGFKSDQKFAGMRDTITKMNANEVKHAIIDNGGKFKAGMKLSMDRFDEDVSWENFKRSGAIALGITAMAATGLAQAYVAAQIKSPNFEGITPWLKAHTMQQLPYGPDMSSW